MHISVVSAMGFQNDFKMYIQPETEFKAESTNLNEKLLLLLKKYKDGIEKEQAIWQ